MDVLHTPCDGLQVDSQTHAQAQAVLPASAGYKWRVLAVSASFSGAAVATPVRAILACGGTNIGRGVSTNDGWQQTFMGGIEGADGAAVTLTLPDGGVGAVGDVMLQAIKVPTLPSGIKV